MNHKIFTLLIAFILSVSAGFAQTLQLETVTDAAPGIVEVNLDMSGFPANIGSATIHIAINTDLLTYTGGGLTFGGGAILTNTVNGELLLSWYNATGANVNGTFAVLKFNYEGALPTNLVFNQSKTEIGNVDATLIPVSAYNNGSIVPTTATVGKIALADITVASVGSNLLMPLRSSAIAPAEDFKQVNAFQFKISYNSAQLAYQGVANNFPGMVIDNSKPGTIILSWSSLTPVDLSSNYLLTNFNFKYLGGGVANLNFKSGFVSTGTSIDHLAIQLIGGSVRVNPTGPIQGVLTLAEVYATDNTMVIVPLHAAEISAPVSVISLNFTYDASKLTYAGYTAQQLSGWTVDVNQGNGTIAATYVNATPQTVNDGNLLSFRFNYTSGEAALAFAAGTAMQTSAIDFLNLELNNGFVNNSIMINALPNNAAYGSVTGGGVVNYNESVTLTATPNAGYSFVNWTEDGNEVSTTAIYSFPATTARDLVANFTANLYALTLAVSPAGAGVLTGGGNYTAGTAVDITAVANPGFQFVNWSNGATEVSEFADFTYTMPMNVTTLTANFRAVYSISGKVKYAEDDFGFSAVIPLSNVYLKSSDGLITYQTDITDSEGNYEFANVTAGIYLLDASSTIDASNSFDATDALIVYYNGNSLTGLRALASDVDLSNDIDVTDANIIYFSFNNGFKVPAWILPSWIFENPVVNVISTDIEINIFGITSGDANADFNPNP